MITFPSLRPLVQVPMRPPASRDAQPGAPAALPPDRFVRRQAPTPASEGEGREAVVAKLDAAQAGLGWAQAPSEKIRLLAGMAQLRTDGAADAIMRAFAEGLPSLTPARQAGLARTFQALVAPGDGGMSAAKRAEVTAYLLKAFAAQPFNGDVQQQLGYALALSGSSAAADALIAHYKRSPATGGETVHRGLYVLATCPHPKVTTFLVDEYGRLAANEAARTQVLTALLDQLKGAGLEQREGALTAAPLQATARGRDRVCQVLLEEYARLDWDGWPNRKKELLEVIAATGSDLALAAFTEEYPP